MKRTITLIIILTTLLTLIPSQPVLAAGETYSDVPAGSWAVEVIEKARVYGLFQGKQAGIFGYGQEISRAEFITVICRIFGWEPIKPQTPSFTDVQPENWAYSNIETALEHNAIDKGGAFKPSAAITREEMAVMLVRALGYTTLADKTEGYALPFTDVFTNKGYITIAYDIGMINGTTPATFAPINTAKREEAAAMLVRVYEKYISKTQFLHGFYAFSSYEQRYVTDKMDAVTFGWSQMCLDAQNGIWLNTGRINENPWAIPDSYELITSYLETRGVKAHLGVHMDISGNSSLREILLSAENRAIAAGVILEESTRAYESIGKSPYSGVTIDFEGLKGPEVKAGFTSFLELLSEQLKTRGMTLYVAVQPALSDGIYFDGFDYRSIGRLSDKVILMAHDYNAMSLEGFVGTSWHKTTALTPISSVYYSLRAITDSNTGVEDKSKIVLALSFATIGWEISENDTVISPTPIKPVTSTVRTRLMQGDTVKGWSEIYMNPYITYNTEEGRRFFLWYEDARSVVEKINLARLFGINGVSIWRIGTIPDIAGEYDVWDSIAGSLAERENAT